MKYPQALSHEVFDYLKQCSTLLGLRAYVVGGYVRDFLLEIPSKDIDVVVEGKGIEFAKKFAELVNAKEVAWYENFGTAMVRYQDIIIEFVGARKESYQRNSRKPIVEEGTLLDDQLRRDFTINALSISLNAEDFGELYDPFQGLDDLKKGIIRTPTNPDITFSDDPLRMMRAVRFATRFQFQIEEKTYQALKDNKHRIDIISKERIAEEFNKMMMATKPSQGYKYLFDTGLLALIFPELHKMQGVDFIDGKGHKDKFYHTLKVLDNVVEKSESLWLRWVAIFHDIGKPATKRYEKENGWTFHGHEDKGARMVPDIFKKMKFPLNEKMKYVQKLTALHQRPIALVNEEVSDSAIRRLVVDAGEDLDDLLLFCRCDITSGIPEKVKRILGKYDVLAARIKAVEERDQLRNWQPPISGEMIMEFYQIKPSKTVGNIKNAIREAILDGIIGNDYESAVSFMREIAPKYLS
ncbi:MAG: CCA tRNA nucleotidyltransferase [Bacteroidia bacterium]